MKYKAIVSGLIEMDIEADDYDKAKAKMEDNLKIVDPLATITIKGFNIEEVAENEKEV